MNTFAFAVALETCLGKELEKEKSTASGEILPLLNHLYEIQENISAFLLRAQQIQIDKEPFPAITLSLLGTENTWINVLASEAAFSTEDLMLLWKIHALIEKTAHFYQQASLNTPHPMTKLFFSSFAELKHTLKRRVQGRLQIVCNHIWSEIGFNPVLFGKE